MFFQQNLPVFVRSFHYPFLWNGKSYTHNEMVPWTEIGMNAEDVSTLMSIDVLYHNQELEKEAKVGDRLSEMNKAQMDTLVNLLNTEVKRVTSSDNELKQKRCKKSKLEDKQRALIRQFLNRSSYITDTFYEIRDKILD